MFDHSGRSSGGGLADASSPVAVPGKRTLIDGLVQQREGEGGADAATTHDAAARGTAGAGGSLPYLDRVQQSFGRHDVGGINAHTDDAAADAADDMGAEAFTIGSDVAFVDEQPELHTVAHEAAHVVQQRAGVHLAGGVGAAGDPYERHADAVADRVVAGQSAEGLLDQMAPAGAAPTSAVQRKVYISQTPAGYRHKNGRTKRGNKAKALMADRVHSYYFKSKDEMSSYVNAQTDEVGMVDKADAWIRLPTAFTVMGEDHSATTVRDLVKATGTTKFKHEGFTAMPADQPGNAALSTALGARATELGAGMRTAPTADNAGEAFLPKVMRQLAEIRIVPARWVVNNDHGERGLWYAILYAKADTGAFAALYATHRALLDPIAAANGKCPADTSMTNEQRTALQTFIARFLELAAPLAAAERTSMGAGDRAAFDTHWQTDGSGRYEGGTMGTRGVTADRADDARDASMFKHIKQAKAEGMKVYGLGDNHRLRMVRLLEAEGIAHVKVDDYLADQKTKHPQT